MTPAALIRELCRHGPRTVGSAGHARAQALLLAELAAIPGGTVAREPFAVTVDEELAAEVRSDGEALPAVRFAGSGGEADGAVEGPIRWCGTGSPAALRAATGAIAVVRAGLRHHRIRQLEAARAAGTRGLVSLAAHPDEPELGLGAAPGAAMPLPGLSLPGRHAARLRAGNQLRLAWRVRRTRREAANLLLHLPGRGPALALGAHYDGWGGGAADNAAGVAVALAVARAWAARRDRPALRLALFDAEEFGLLGSAHHLARRGPHALRACLNLDQPVPGRGCRVRTVFLGLRLWATPAPLACLRRGFLPLPLDWIYRVLGDLFPSDVHHFHRLGVPAATTFCGGPRHRDGDRPAGLEPAGLARAVALAGDLLAAAGR